MKRFNQFLEEKKKKKVVVVDVAPTHGSHSTEKTSKKLKEDNSSTVTSHPTHGAHSVGKLDDWLKVNDNEHVGDNHAEQEISLHAHYKLDNLPDEHRRAIKKYTEYSANLNRHLINKEAGKEKPTDDEYGAEQHEQHETHAKHISEGLQHTHLPYSLTVYHGCGFNPNEFANQSSERTIKMPAFTSTTINKNKAVQFSKTLNYDKEPDKHIMAIHLPKGHKGVHYVGKESEYDNERELLMDKGAKLKIHPEPEIHHVSYEDNYHGRTTLPPGKYHIWHATPVD